MSEPKQKKKNPGLIIIIVAFLAVLAVNLTSGSEKVKWADSIESAEKAAQNNGKPIMVLFTTKTGKYESDCNRMSYATINKPDVVKFINKTFNPVLIDYDNNESVAKKYDVSQLPAIVIKLYNTDEYRKLVGYISDKEFHSRTGNVVKELKK